MSDLEAAMTHLQETRAVVEAQIVESYGYSEMSLALAKHLAEKIDAWGPNDNRERMIRTTCWDWYAGGDTAARTARKIEEQL